MTASFFEMIKMKGMDSMTNRSIDIYKEEDARYFVFHTPSLNEFLDGQKKIIEKGFYYSKRKEPGKSDSFFFKKEIYALKLKVVSMKI